MPKPTTLLSISLLAVLALGCEDKKATKPTASRAKTRKAEPAAPTPSATRQRPSLKADEDKPDEAGGETTTAGNSDAPGFPEKGRWQMNDRAKFDTDGNGRLNKEEREAMRTARIDNALKTLDTNGDGAITEAELENSDERTARRVRRRFGRYDLDKDGSISREELTQGMKRRRPPRGWGRRDRQPPPTQ